MPRPTTLTEAKTRLICEALKKGHGYKAAARLAKVSVNTLHQWRKSGRKTNASKLHKDFALKVELARAQAIRIQEEVVFKAGKNGDANMALKWLRIHNTEEWGDQPTHLVVEQVDEDARDKEMRIQMRKLKAAYDAMEDEKDEERPASSF